MMYFRATEESAPPVHEALEHAPALCEHLSVESLLALVKNRTLSVGWQRLAGTPVSVVLTTTNAAGGTVTEVHLRDSDDPDLWSVVGFTAAGSSAGSSADDMSAVCSCLEFEPSSPCWHVAVAGLRLLGYDPDPVGRPRGSGSDVAATLIEHATSWRGLVETVLTMPTWGPADSTASDPLSAVSNAQFCAGMMLAVGEHLIEVACSRAGSDRRGDALVALGELVAGAPNSVRRWTHIDTYLRSMLASLWELLEAAVNARVDDLVERRVALDDIGVDVPYAVARAAVEVTASGVSGPLDGKLLARMPNHPVDSMLSLYLALPEDGTLAGRGPQVNAARRSMRNVRVEDAAVLRGVTRSRRVEATHR